MDVINEMLNSIRDNPIKLGQLMAALDSDKGTVPEEFRPWLNAAIDDLPMNLRRNYDEWYLIFLEQPLLAQIKVLSDSQQSVPLELQERQQNIRFRLRNLPVL